MKATVELITLMRKLANRIESLDGDTVIDPPPAWWTREEQDELRSLLAELKGLVREMPADASARAFLDPDELN